MNRQARIYVAGGRRTLAGAALLEHLRAAGFTQLVTGGEPDLSCARSVDGFFREARPEYVFLAAGLSGGIALNQARPAELMLDNLLVAAHVVHAAHAHKARRLLYLASSCSYPRLAPQPMRPDALLGGPPEPTCAAYATAKLAGWQLCEAYRRQYGDDFITAIPANAFGPHDDFGPASGHVVPALIRRMDEAKERDEPSVTIWGTGTPVREFLFARDLADACVFAIEHHQGPEPINLGGGAELAIAEVAHAVAGVVGYRGRLVFDPSRPDGAPRKALDSSRLRQMGWRPRTDFRAALAQTYHWYLKHAKEGLQDASPAVPLAVPHPPSRGGDRARLPVG